MMRHVQLAKIAYFRLASCIVLTACFFAVMPRGIAGTLQNFDSYPAPLSLVLEHEKQLAAINIAIQSGGETGAIAENLLQKSTAHIQKEMQFVLPQLSYLPMLAYEGVVFESDELVRLTDILRRELPTMFEEHRELTNLAGMLRAAAEREGKQAQVKFANELVLHIEMQEEIVYPASLLMGEAARLLQQLK